MGELVSDPTRRWERCLPRRSGAVSRGALEFWEEFLPSLFSKGAKVGYTLRGPCLAMERDVGDRKNHRVNLIDDTSGAVFTEYVVVLLLVGTITAAATYSLGRPLVDYYRFAQLILALPFP